MGRITLALCGTLTFGDGSFQDGIFHLPVSNVKAF